MPPVAVSNPPAPSSPTLAELRALELRYDGPIPPQALADLRASSQQPIAPACLSEAALQHWARLTRTNLKAEQRRLAARRAKLVAVRTTMLIDDLARMYGVMLASREVAWSLQQCRAARTQAQTCAREGLRRAQATRTLQPYVRTLGAVNVALGMTSRECSVTSRP